MPIKPEFQKYSVFVRASHNSFPTFQELEKSAADVTDLESEKELGVYLAREALSRGILNDPNLKERGILGVVGVAGINILSGTHSEQTTERTALDATHNELMSGFLETLLQYQQLLAEEESDNTPTQLIK